MKNILILIMLSLTGCSVVNVYSYEIAPKAVQDAYWAKFPNVSMEGWRRVDSNEYKVSFDMFKDPNDYVVWYDKGGKWLEIKILMKKVQLPGNAAANITAVYPGSKIKGVKQVLKPGIETYYEIIINDGKFYRVITTSATGEILAEKIGAIWPMRRKIAFEEK